MDPAVDEKHRGEERSCAQMSNPSVVGVAVGYAFVGCTASNPALWR